MYFMVSNTAKSSSDDCEKSPIKQRKMNKTPVSILTELSTQKKVPQPVYTEIDNNGHNASNVTSRFSMKCTAFNKSAVGYGVTKKAAKHAAAEKLLQKIHNSCESDDDESDDDPAPSYSINNDYVTELLDLCVQKNFHKPDFVLVESYGPTHAPTFTFECRLDTIRRRGSASTKTLAKKISAMNVLDILKLSYPDQEKKLMVINDENNAKTEARRKITSYLELKKQNKNDEMGTTLRDRHNFYLNYKNEELINSLKEILLKDLELNEKYKLFLDELGTEWYYSVDTFGDTDLLIFDLAIDFDQFSTSLVCKKEEMAETVINYFELMLQLTPTSRYVPNKIVSEEEIVLNQLF